MVKISTVENLENLSEETEKILEKAMNSNFERNEQLNSLLHRSDVLREKNAAFGLGMTDFRKQIEQKDIFNRLKIVALGFFIFFTVFLVIFLKIFQISSNRTVNF